MSAIRLGEVGLDSNQHRCCLCGSYQNVDYCEGCHKWFCADHMKYSALPERALWALRERILGQHTPF